jgi:hypothetical protein
MQDKIRQELTVAMKARDAVRVSTLRGLVAAFINELVAKNRKPEDKLTDDEAIAVIKRGVKQRKDSIEQFEKGGRQDLVDKETAELKILETYLPQMMSKEDIEKTVRAMLEKMGPVDKAKSGQFVGAVMKELKGKADGGDVKVVVDTVLS